MRKCWDCHWRERVIANAEMSTCRTRHVGGVLVRNNRVIADGFNGNLPGHPHCDEGGCPRCNDPNVKSGEQLDRCFCVHAEQNIFAHCAKNGISTEGTTLYLPANSCVDCWKLAVSCGISEEVYEDPYPGALGTVKDMAVMSDIALRTYHCTCGRADDLRNLSRAGSC